MNVAPTFPILAASIAVFRDDGRVLLAMRGRPPMKGVWTLPGGRVEPGETLAQAALRELEEEVGVTADLIGFNTHVEHIRRNDAGAVARHFVIASFIGRWRSGEPRTGPEADAVMWADPFDLKDLTVTEGLPAVLRHAAVLAAKAGLP